MPGFSAPARWLLRSIVLALVSAALATPGAAQAPALPDSAQLVTRMTSLHRAMTAGDAAGWYALTTPVTRRQMTLEQFRADLRLGEARRATPGPETQAALERNCGCSPIPVGPGAVRCVLVVSVRLDSLPQGPRRWIESWDRIDRQWYWVYGQPHARNPVDQPPRCPGEP